MTKLNIALLICLAVSLLLSLWLANEHRRKFGFINDWATRSAQIVNYFYPGPEKFGHKPAMRNIVLRGTKPFSALVCMRWHLAGKDFGIDPYGVVHSDKYGMAVVSTYFGYGEVTFIFVPNVDANVEATSTDADQYFTPDATYEPHLVQTLGIYKG